MSSNSWFGQKILGKKKKKHEEPEPEPEPEPELPEEPEEIAEDKPNSRGQVSAPMASRSGLDYAYAAHEQRRRNSRKKGLRAAVLAGAKEGGSALRKAVSDGLRYYSGHS